jgi:hypothetical protein
MNKRRFIGSVCLLAYLLGWLGSTQAMPILLVSIGHSHKIFLAQHGDTLQIALHHPGYVDEHEPVSTHHLEVYQHDLLDKVLFVLSNRDNHDYSDHIICIPLDKQPTIATSKKVNGKKINLPTGFSFLATAPPFPTFAKLARLPHLSQPPPDIPSIPLHLRTTVLLN